MSDLRREEFSVEIAASLDEVWTMLTTDRGVAAWYGVDADIDPRPGGTYRVGWGDEVAEATVDAVEPLRRLRLVYDPADPSGAEEWPLRWALEGASSPWRVAACRTVAVPDRATGWRQVLDGLGLVRTPANGDAVPAVGTVALVDAPHSLLITGDDTPLLCDLEGEGDHLAI